MKELKRLSVVDIGARREFTVQASELWPDRKEMEDALAFYRRHFLHASGTSRLDPEIEWILAVCANGNSTFCIRLVQREEAVAGAVFQSVEESAEAGWALVEDLYLKDAGLIGTLARPTAPWMFTGLHGTMTTLPFSAGCQVLNTLLEIGWSCWHSLNGNWEVVLASELAMLNTERRKNRQRVAKLLSQHEDAQRESGRLREMLRNLELDKARLLQRVTGLSNEAKERRIHDLQSQLLDAQQEASATRADSEQSFRKLTEVERQLEDYRRATAYHQGLLRQAGISFNSVIGHGHDHHRNKAA